MFCKNIQRTVFWILMLMSIANLNVDEHITDACDKAYMYRDRQIFYQVKKGIRSQRKALKRSRAKEALDCVWFCLDEETCTSFNYAELTSVGDGEENCELHNGRQNTDGNPLEFLKDDRYTFYQIPGGEYGPESRQNIGNVTEPANIPRLSCLDHFNNGSKTSGEYTILDWQQKPRRVFCDMESEPESVWTLVMSYTRENSVMLHFSKAMYEDDPANEYTPNWSNYRMSLNQLSDMRSKTTHWRATCSFLQYADDIYTDYVQAVFTDFDLMGPFFAECKKASYISVIGQNCSECTSRWWQGYGFAPNTDCSCDLGIIKCCYFGVDFVDNFRCTNQSTSTTNYWFGSYV